MNPAFRARLFSCGLLAMQAASAFAEDGGAIAGAKVTEYMFDASLFRGQGLSQAALMRFNRADAVAPGNYRVELFVNGRFVERADIAFQVQADESVRPCIPDALLKRAGVGSEVGQGEGIGCVVAERTMTGIRTQFDLPRLRLDMSVPQQLMRRTPRGPMAPASLDHGETMGFVNYTASAYHLSSGRSARGGAHASFDAGLNLGAWRLRQQSIASYPQAGRMRWHNTRRHAQRAFPGFGSMLTVGEGATPGRFFPALRHAGVEWATDERMLPDTSRGYAPVVRGVARTQARVSIRQNGSEIHQVTVAPGGFEIDDLYPTRYSGDLEVVVSEADGGTSRFTVPFSAAPESLRPGASRHRLTVGWLRDTSHAVAFGDITYQRGLGNAFTAQAGARLAGGYQAWMLGGTCAGRFGAIGLETIWSRANPPGGKGEDGSRTRLAYSRVIAPVGTMLSLAGYRYAGSGYRDLDEVLGERRAGEADRAGSMRDHRQRMRLEMTLNQSLGRWGGVHVSASTGSARASRRAERQLQVGYANLLPRSISVNLSVARAMSSLPCLAWAAGCNGVAGMPEVAAPVRFDTVTSLALSMPLGRPAGGATPSMGASYTGHREGGFHQANLSGTMVMDPRMHYALGLTQDTRRRDRVASGSLQAQRPAATFGLMASHGANYWQGAFNLRGALALHAGGLTLGPYLDDTFALVEAKGAKGARVSNGLGATLDRRGYALVPTLMPYRYNTVALDPAGMDGDMELETGEQRVAPDAGAAVKVVFRTRRGQALLIEAALPDGKAVPMGAQVRDGSGGIVGVVGQGGQVYLRTATTRGVLELDWGEFSHERCALAYAFSDEQANPPLVRLRLPCVSH